MAAGCILLFLFVILVLLLVVDNDATHHHVLAVRAQGLYVVLTLDTFLLIAETK